MGHISIEKYNDVNYPSKNEMLYPNKNYIELPFEFENYSENNKIFEMVRDGLKDLKMDIENYGKKEWNPFKGIIKEDNNILIKPNLVMHKNGAGFGEECLYTSPSLVAAIIPYIYKALNGKGKITIADAPMQSCDFQKLIEDSGYKELVQYYKNKGNDFLNLRNVVFELSLYFVFCCGLGWQIFKCCLILFTVFVHNNIKHYEII